MAAAQPPLLRHIKFLKDGLFIPARNPGLFGPIWALAVAETALQTAVLDGAQGEPVVAGAGILLTSMTIGLVVKAMTTATAVAVTLSIDDDNATEHDDASSLGSRRRVLATDVLGTAAYCKVMAIVWRSNLAALVALVDAIAGYTRSPLVVDLLVLVHLAAGLATAYVDVALPVAVVEAAASEPGMGCYRGAALRHAFRVTAENADLTAVLVVAMHVRISVVIRPAWNATAWDYPMEWIGILMSSAVHVLAVVTAYYHECMHRARTMPPPRWWHVLATGKEWLHGLPIRIWDGLKDLLQGRSSVRHVAAATLVRVRRWTVWVLLFLSTHPWVASALVVCAAALILEEPQSGFYQNRLFAYRNYLRRKHQIHPRGCGN